MADYLTKKDAHPYTDYYPVTGSGSGTGCLSGNPGSSYVLTNVGTGEIFINYMDSGVTTGIETAGGRVEVMDPGTTVTWWADPNQNRLWFCCANGVTSVLRVQPA